ncbi:hypothetical protein [Thiosocius teredinicola]|uniref:hypothetical protein n=1 Tax=Thiosocius teredinicola TaxID=1973002 RepID=UPI000F78DD25
MLGPDAEWAAYCAEEGKSDPECTEYRNGEDSEIEDFGAAIDLAFLVPQFAIVFFRRFAGWHLGYVFANIAERITRRSSRSLCSLGRPALRTVLRVASPFSRKRRSALAAA